MKKWASILALILACALVIPMAGCQKAPGAADAGEKELVLFTWSDYFPQDVLDAFTEETGIKVVYTYFDSNEEMLTKLQANNGGEYDVVLASDYIIDIARQENLLKELDKEQMPNYEYLDPVFLSQFYDPDNKYCVPYAAGTPLIIYDPARVDIEINGYEDLWDESLADSIVIMDDMRNVLGITLKTMGESFNTTDEAVLAEAGEKLLKLKPNIRALDYNNPHELMISGEASVGYMFTPQVLWALSERPDLKVVYPEEGMGFGIDNCFVPANAPNAENAFAFLNYICDPEVSAKLSEFTLYINCNTAAKEYLSEDYLSNEALYIPSEILGNTEFIQDVGTETTAVMDELWTRFKQQ